MKHLLIIFSLLLTSVSWSKDLEFKDLVKREGLYYEKFKDEPFNGTVTGMHQGKIKKGKREGEWLFFLKSGQLYDRTNYKNDKLHGERKVYHTLSGELSLRGNWKDGKKKIL